MDKKIIVIGAGIGGLTVGIGLKKLGYQITIYESSKSIEGIGAGLGLASNAIHALKYLKLSDGISKFGAPVSATRILTKDGKLLVEADSKLLKNAESHVNFALHRKDLHQYLYTQLDQTEVIPDKRAYKFTQTKDNVFIEFTDGTSDSADFLIAADGVGSTIRKSLVPKSFPRYAGYTCWRAVIQNPGIPTLESSEVWGKEGRFGYVSLHPDLIYWYACINTKKRNVRSFGLEELQNNFSSYAAPIPDILNHTFDSQLIQNDIVDIKPLKKFAFQRILLIGDAAHATTPNMGQGACMALEDAAVLIHELQHTPSEIESFKRFEKKRLQRTRYIIITSRRMGRIAQWDNPWLIPIRNGIFKHMPKSFIKRQMKILLEKDIFSN